MAHGTSKAILGLGAANDAGAGTASNSLDTLATTTAELTTLQARVTALETDDARVYKTVAIAGADNTTSHDYTVSGATASSRVVAAFYLSTADAQGSLTAVTGTLTAGANKVTVAAGADLSSAKTIVFVVLI